MRRNYRLLAVALFALATVAVSAQPTIVGTQVANGTYTNYSLSNLGNFVQARIQASSTGTAGRTWEFGEGTTGSPNYTANWRPVSGSGSQIQIPGFNAFIGPAAGSPPPNGSATFNTSSGGVSGTLPTVTSGMYYTFNLSKNSVSGTPANENMAVLATSYNPVAINSVTRTPSGGSLSANAAVEVSIALAATPSSGEFFYIRYSNTSNFSSSTLIPVQISGTSGLAILPCTAPGQTAYYYVFSSNLTLTQLLASVSSNGEKALNVLGLNINNNGGSNYSYTVSGSATTFSGNYAIPSSCFPTIASFVTALNTGTITGPVNALIKRGHFETAPAGGINLTATGTSAAPIKFIATGSGPKPKIKAPVGLNSLGTSNVVLDFIWSIEGGDYITIDGIDLLDSNTTGAALMENGFQITRRTSLDASQFVTIKNCKIVFLANQIATGLASTYDNGNKGIAFIPAINNTLTTATAITSLSGRCINDSISRDTVINASIGIYVRSFSDVAAPFTLLDQNIVINNNFVFQFGEAGIKTFNVNNISIINNTVNNNNQVGYNASLNTALSGIWPGGNSTNNANLNVTGNTIILRNIYSTGIIYGIRHVSENGGFGNHFFRNNIITKMYNTQSGISYGIYAQSNANTLHITGNEITKSRFFTTTNISYGILSAASSHTVFNKIRVRENIITEDTVNFVFYGINTAMTTTTVGLYNNGIEISKNTIGSLDTNKGIVYLGLSGSTCYGIFANIAQWQVNVDSNIIANHKFFGSGIYTWYGCYNFASPTGGLFTFRNNMVRFIKGNNANGSSLANGFRLGTTLANSGIINKNYFGNFSGWNSISGVNISFGNLLLVKENTIDSLFCGNGFTTGTGSAIGIDHNGTSSADTLIIEDNLIKRIVANSGLTTASNSLAVGINSTTGTTSFIQRNKIFDISNIAAYGSAKGMTISSGTTRFINNNLIGDIKNNFQSSSSNIPNVIGLELASGGSSAIPMKIFNNTIYLNVNSNSFTAFTSAGVNYTGAAFTDFSNNIVYNTSTAGSTGFTAGLHSTVTNATFITYHLRGNNNLWYTGTPSARRPLYRNSSNATSDTTMCQFYTRLTTPRELNSVNGMVTFKSTNGNSADFLMVDGSVSTLAESGGKWISELTNDYQMDARNLIPDIGADEFSGSRPSFGNGTFTSTITQPSTAAVLANSKNQLLLSSAITVTPSTSTPTVVNRMVFNTSGSTNASTSIDTAKLWYTVGTATFTNPVLLGAIPNPSSSMVFTPNQAFSCAQQVYYWITYSLKCPGSGFVVDCQMDSIYLNGSGSSITSGAPAGTRSITDVQGMSGTYTVGGASPTYTTLTAAIADVNSRGLTGNVILEIRPALRERVAAAGLVLDVTGFGCGASKPNKNRTLTIKSSSSSAKPILYAGAGLYLNGGSGPLDGILKIVGEDWVTIDGLDFRDTSLNTTSTLRTESAIALLKDNALDGCKNVVIQNCAIRLDKLNAATGNIRTGSGSVGIMVCNMTNASTSSLALLGRGGAHDSISIKNNTITSCYYPIIWYGFEASINSVLDQNDSIIGNTITNFGGGGSEQNGIQMMNVNRFYIANNNINNMANSGASLVNAAGTLYGIRVGAGTSNTSIVENFTSGKILNNTISLDYAPSSAFTGVWGGIGIYCGGRNSSIEVSDNKIVNINAGINQNSTFFGINNFAAFNSFVANRNRIDNLTLQRGFAGIQNTGFSKYCEISNDTFRNITCAYGTSTNVQGILRTYTSVALPLFDSILRINNNLLYKVNYTPTTLSGFVLNAVNATLQPYLNVEVNNNTARNIIGQDIPQVINISNGNLVSIKGNTIDSIYSTAYATAASPAAIFSTGHDSVTISNNSITRFNVGATALSAGFGILSQTTNFVNINNNKVADLNFSASSGLVEGIRCNVGFESVIYNNYVGDVKFPGITSTAVSLSGIATYGNQLSNINYNTVNLGSTTTGTSLISAAYFMGSTTGRFNVSNNIFYNTSATGTSGFNCAFAKNGTGLSSIGYLPTSNNNLLYAGSPSGQSVIFRNMTDAVSDISICDWKTRSSLGNGVRDLKSLSGSLTWLSTTSTSSNYLHIDNSVNTLVEGTGTPISTILTDYDGNTRNSTTPDIGADEGGFTFPSSSITVSASASHPSLATLPQGATAQILRIDVVVAGANKTLPITELKFNTAGTTNPTNNIDSAKVYFTGNSSFFSPISKFGNTVAAPNGAFTIAGNIDLYCNDTFYLWLVYNVKCGSAGDSIDGRLDSLKISGTAYGTTSGDPTGKIGIGSPMSGTYTVGGSSPDYTSLADAVSDINRKGLSGALTLEVRANHTEIAPAGGISLYINSSCPGGRPNKFRPLIIQKSGTGANPKIYNFTGNNTLATANPDGIFRIVGEDWVTIDGIDVEDTSTSLLPTTLMEWGYALMVASPTDGCKRVVIKNCDIKMSKNHKGTGLTQAGSSGSQGIVVGNLQPGVLGPVTITSKSGSHDSCMFFKNTISRVNNGIMVMGFLDVAPFSLFNQNDSMVGNNITNFGDSNTIALSCNGIRTIETNNQYIADNYIDNMANGGKASNAQTIGIFNSATALLGNQNLIIERNSIRVRSSGSASILAGIVVSGGGLSNTEIVRNNKVWGSGNSGATANTNIGILSQNRPQRLIIENDTFIDFTCRGSFSGISVNVGGAYYTVKENLIKNNRLITGSTSTFTGIQVAGTADRGEIINNVIDGGSTQTGQILGINVLTVLEGTVLNNTIKNLAQRLNTTTSFIYGINANFTGGNNFNCSGNTIENDTTYYAHYGIYLPGTSNNLTSSRNIMNKMYQLPGSSNTISYFIYQPSTVSNRVNIDSNVISNDTARNSYYQYLIYANPSALQLNIRNNSFNNIFQTFSAINLVTGIHAQGSNKEVNILNNQFLNDTFNANLSNIVYTGNLATSNVNIKKNIIENNRIAGSHIGINLSASNNRFTNIESNSFNNNTIWGITNNLINAAGGNRFKKISNNSFTNNNYRSASTSTNYLVINTVTAASDSLIVFRENFFNNNIAYLSSTSMFAYYNNSFGSFRLSEITNKNTIRNLIVTNATSGAGNVYGIYNSNGSSAPYPLKDIDSNTIVNLRNVNGTGSSSGIYVSFSGNVNNSINNNYVDSIVNGGVINGIEIASTGNFGLSISRNKIGNVTANGLATLPSVNGIKYNMSSSAGLVKSFIQNNTVGLLSSPFTAPNFIRGISLENANASDSIFIDYNSVYLNSTTSGTSNPSTGIYLNTNPKAVLRNNNIDVLSAQIGTGVIAAIQRSNNTISSLGAQSNNNNLNIGAAGTNKFLLTDGTNLITTLANYKSLFAPRESNSVNVAPVYQTTTVRLDSFLKLSENSTLNCDLNRKGKPISGITTDYWNKIRNSSKPDIGAHEFDLFPIDITKQPKDTVICNGGTAKFTVQNNTSGLSNYKWYKNGIEISNGGIVSGATTATLTLTAATISDTGTFTVKIWICAGDTATSNAVKLQISTPNTIATGISMTVNDSVCSGTSVKLKPIGGAKGVGGVWKWYTGSCNGTLIGVGDSINVSPTSTTIYYLKAASSCDSTSCVFDTLVVLQSSTAPTGITSSADTTCPGSAVTLSVTGGSLGSFASWKWYSGSCGGTSVGAGASISVSPTVPTKYFVRAEGTCNTTACVSKTINLYDTSKPATSISGTTAICSGGSTTLTVSGGSLGSGANWVWYFNACGGSPVGTGTSVTLSPFNTSTYYVRAEGLCNNTICKSVTITVKDSSEPATSITGTTTVCKGKSTKLYVNGGSLGTSATWKWYSGSCGGTLVGTGDSVSVAPASNTTYFVRAEGTCNSTTCVSTSVTVKDTSLPATGISGTTTICLGTSTTLTLSGGSLGDGASWKWYSSSCGSTLVGTGTSITVSPATTTTYYVRAEGTCNTTVCKNATVTVEDTSKPATSISGTTAICLGTSTTLTVNGGSLGAGADWYWYMSTCGGNPIGTGTSITVNPPVNVTYYVRAEGNCNSTACATVSVTIKDTSIPATSISGTTTICKGSSTTLTLSGGSLGDAASWKWYSGSCGGTAVGTGTSVTVAPSSNTTYYVRAEGTCNNTVCISKAITVQDTSIPATSISGTGTVCNGSSTTLSVTGGTLGTGAAWKWYSGTCGGTLVGTGTSVSVAPSSNTSYFVRAEGTCNTTSCVSKSITVQDTSIPATSISATLDSGCFGVNTTLTVSGGSLGTGASWKWYSGSCGGTSIGTGTSVTISISSTQNYYVRAEGTCGNSACVVKQIKIRTTSTPASAASSSPSTICIKNSATLSLTGGNLGAGGAWKWYTGSCGGTLVGTGSSITVSPATTTTYYLRAEDVCGSTTCVTTVVTVRDSSKVASSITVPSNVCIGTAFSLTPSGGTLGHGASWKWYGSSCGGTLLGTGNSLSQTLANTSPVTYYLRAEGTCNTTICTSVTVTAKDTSTPPTSISGTNNICAGTSTTLSVNGGSLGAGASWKWYSGTCGGTLVGTGTSVTVSPTANTNYYVRAEGTCNSTKCATILVTMKDTSVPATSITGTTSICRGSSTTLSVSGGTLGAGASWKWYSASCGGTIVGTGTSITVTPTANTSYFVRAEGTCNTTLCRSATVTLKDTSVPAIFINGTTTICKGTSTSLQVIGGTLGSGASWKWYSGSCGGTSVGTGTSVSVAPSANTDYFVRAEGTCNTTICQSVSVTLRDTSKPATSITGTTTVCKGTSTTLTVNGGTLGFGASWKWYTGSCAGTPVGTGSSITVSPTANTTYFVKAEGTCNNTTCVSTSVTVNDTSSMAAGITGTTTICKGKSTTLSILGGSLGTGGSWKWYSGSCGGTSVGTGTSITVAPSANITYFVRAEGTCNTTLCRNAAITVQDTSIPATSITGTTTVCKGGSTTLTVNGGTLGTSATWRWYSGSCGGSSIGTGTSITIAPSSNTTYFVRAEGTCNTTICRSTSVTVNDTSTMAAGISGTTTICKGTSTTLSVIGGNLGTGATWKWYSGSCGGTAVGTGASVTVAPSSNTTYFVRAEGTCNNTLCRSTSVTVNDTSFMATGISGTATICKGSSTTLSVTGGSLGTGASWKWYSGSCGGTPVGTGSSITVAPSANTTYFVRAEGTCNTTLCKNISITVNDTSSMAFGISGNATVCKGSSTTLSVIGGNLGTGASWKWYSGSCGGTAVGTGASVSAAPSANTTYFVRAEGTCNTTLCRSTVITVNDTSIAPTSISGTTALCKGSSTTLTVSGGQLGTGAIWKWYTVGCGVNAIAVGNSITVTPNSSIQYFVRAEGGCNTTVCKSVTVTVNDTNIMAASISGPSTVCKNSVTTYTVTGGNLGTGASWKWYRNACGGSSFATGSSITVTATANTSYFVRAEGGCNTTACQSINITVQDTSVAANGIVGNTTLCTGTSTTLTVQGGTLGTGAAWKWYEGACGTNLVGTGTSITVTPLSSKTYFVRAEGNCNITPCKSLLVTVLDTSIAPTNVSGINNICKGESTSLTVLGGKLGTGAVWNWYTGSCGGTSVGTGTLISVQPKFTTTYFVRGEGSCNNTLCASVTIIVNDTSTKATSITATQTTICEGGFTTLQVNGGKLGAGANWVWYKDDCGGAAITTGTVLFVSPTDTATYYVRAEGLCNTTSCVGITINVIHAPKAPVSIHSNYDTVCQGTLVKLWLTGPKLKSNESYKWYSGTCGASLIGTGDTIYATLASSTSVFVRSENSCFSSTCLSKSIHVLNYAAGTWVGIKSTNWNDADNWCSGVPTSTTDVVIPAGTKYKPIVSTTAMSHNLTINTGATVTINSGAVYSLYGDYTNSGTLISNGTIAFVSTHNVNVDKLTSDAIVMNSNNVVNLNSDLKVTRMLTLTNGVINTNGDTVYVLNNNAKSVEAGLGNTNFTKSWINGTLYRDMLSTKDTAYHFPVGNASNGHDAVVNMHKMLGVDYMLMKFDTKQGTDQWLHVKQGGTWFTSVANGGVWKLSANASVPAGGTFDLKLYFNNNSAFTSGMNDNSFSILQRPMNSSLGEDWKLPADTSNYVAGLVANGYVERNNISTYQQFGIGLSTWAVHTNASAGFKDIKVYPNPSDKVMNIALGSSSMANQSFNVDLITVDGKILRSSLNQAGGTTLTWNLDKVSEGVYFMRIVNTQTGEMETIRVMKIAKD